MISLDARREILCDKFANKILNSAVMKSNVESNIKTHNMKTRNPEQYEVTFALTQ